MQGLGDPIEGTVVCTLTLRCSGDMDGAWRSCGAKVALSWRTVERAAMGDMVPMLSWYTVDMYLDSF